MFAGGPADRYTLVYKLTRAKIVFLMFCLTTKKWIIRADQGNFKNTGKVHDFVTMMSSPVKAIENYCNPLQVNRCYWQNNMTPSQFVVHVDNITLPSMSM